MGVTVKIMGKFVQSPKKMIDKMDMSLDDIIKIGRSGRGVGSRKGQGDGSRAGGQRRASFKGGPGREGGITKPYNQGDVNNSWKHDLFVSYGPRKAAAARTTAESSLGPAKLTVSNLDFGVSDSDIQELFDEFGPLKNAAVHYDRSGRSLGTADVIFERRSDAIKAMKQYNGVPLDGRAMNIQLTTSEVLSVLKRTYSGQGKRTWPNRPLWGAGKGRPGRGRHGSFRKQNRPQLTAEQLDAELEAYSKEIE